MQGSAEQAARAAQLEQVQSGLALGRQFLSAELARKLGILVAAPLAVLPQHLLTVQHMQPHLPIMVSSHARQLTASEASSSRLTRNSSC